MNKTDVSIEYAHIYTNDKINKEHELSVSILKDLEEKLKQEGSTYSLTVLIDDYSFPDTSFDYESFTAWLVERRFAPDVILRESELIPQCDQVLTRINDMKLKKELLSYVKTKRYPCSLFIAAWYLLRLGHLEHEKYNEKFVARRLTNILPLSFKPFEDKALEIIANTNFSGAEKSIEYSYIEGRTLA